MAEQLDLCIVIPTFNRKAQLSTLLTQLRKQKINFIKYKIVVVVDGSTDGTLELLKSDFPEVIVIKGNGNWWFTRSLNEGCKYSVMSQKTKLVLTLNDDVQIPDDYLQKMLANYSDCEENSIIGSSSYSLSQPRMVTFAGFKRKNQFLLKYYHYISPFTRIEPGELKGLVSSITLPTRGLLIPASVLKKINYLDEKTFPQYSSDYDLVLRAAKQGTKVFISYDAYLFEDMNLTSQGNPRLAKTFGQYFSNVFSNKYSANYFLNRMNMCWRHGIKLFIPLYFMIGLIAVPYVYSKYNFFLNKKITQNN